MNKLYFIGDTHGKWKDFENTIIVRGIRDAYIWHVGDGIFGLTNRRSDKEILNMLNNFLLSRNIILYNTRGNHDNPYWFKSEDALIKQFEKEDKSIKSWNKEDYYYKHYYLNPIDFTNYIKNLSNIKFVKDYEIVNLNGLNILSIGGAISVDRKIQLHDGSYFPIEKVSYNSKIHDIKNIDIVVTHTVPLFAEPKTFAKIVYEYAVYDNNLIYELTQERKLLTKIHDELIKKNSNINYWFYGHYHHFIQNNYGDINFICLGILELFEIDWLNRNVTRS